MQFNVAFARELVSHPVRVRGLKLPTTIFRSFGHTVAPRVGAWIETIYTSYSINHFLVAPRVGAWIETRSIRITSWTTSSHPVWVRGLKHGLLDLCDFFRFVAPRVGAWIETCSLMLHLHANLCHIRLGCVLFKQN